MEEKKVIRIVQEPKKSELVKGCYEVIGCMHEVYRQLGAGLPEYIYQEALAKQLALKGLTYHKELQFHPLFNGEPLEAYLKMDLVVESAVGKIIVECKAITQLGEKEHYQTFGYLRGTGWPVAMLVNFGASPKAQIERFYNNEGMIEVF